MRLLPIILLTFSNLFMTYAWYGHLKDQRAQPIMIVILFSWGVAFFEYCLMVPANRIGAGMFTLPQLKVMQEILTMIVFAGFCVFYMREKLTWDYLWAGLCLPLCLGVRSDALWAPWALVAMTAVILWIQSQGSSSWRFGPDEVAVHAQAWAAAAVLAVGLSAPLRPLTGAGVWAFRTAATLAVTLVMLTAMAGLFAAGVGPRYWIGLLVLAGAAAVLASPRAFDIGALSAVALGLDTLLVAGLAHFLLADFHGGDPIGELLILGLAAAGLLAASVNAVLRAARRGGQGGAA